MPEVILIGDSIRMEYQDAVQQELGDAAVAADKWARARQPVGVAAAVPQRTADATRAPVSSSCPLIGQRASLSPPPGRGPGRFLLHLRKA